MPDYADTAAKRFQNAIAEMQRRVGDLFMTLRDLPADEIMFQLQSLNLEEMITGLLKPELARLQATYAAGLELIAPSGAVSAAVLDGLVAFEMAEYGATVSQMATQLQKLVAQSAIAGMSEANFAASLAKTGLQPYQANALANQSLRTFQRTVKDQIAQVAPPDKLYIYEGPNDDKTDDYCLDMLAAGPLTYEQIESQFPGTFTAGGHYNCRHSWEPYVRESQRKDKEFELLDQS
jgi:uncharacterized protein YejL (UPF0352 family)